jgi:hypothetical protein
MNLAFALDQLQKARRLTKDGKKSMVRQREAVAGLESHGTMRLKPSCFSKT